MLILMVLSNSSIVSVSFLLIVNKMREDEAAAFVCRFEIMWKNGRNYAENTGREKESEYIMRIINFTNYITITKCFLHDYLTYIGI